MASAWTTATDPSSGRTYYYNASTNETSWDPPAGLAPAAATPASSASDWSKVKDPGSGKFYYFNARTNVTQWDPPAGFSDGSAPAPAPAPAASAAATRAGSVVEEPAGTRKSASARKSMIQRRGQQTKRIVKPQSVAEKLAARSRKFISMRKAEKAKTQPSAFTRKRAAGPSAATAGVARSAAAAAPAAAAPAPAPAAGGVPAPWQAVVDPGSGRTYYYNPVTSVTTWDLPTA